MTTEPRASAPFGPKGRYDQDQINELEALSLAPADRPAWVLCDHCKVGDHDDCTMPETNEECCCGA